MRKHMWIMVAAFAVSGCVGDITGTGDGDGSGSDDDMEPVVCEATRSYTGFGGDKLEASRPAIEPGSDRLRLKPYAALANEYKAALGLAAFDTATYAPTFGRPPARWYTEPQASANTLYAAFALAYDGCTQKMATDAQYATAPTTAAAEIVCNDLVRRAWHREPTAEETTSCVDYAVTQTLASDAPRTRWSYTCAAVLSASGFLAY